MRNRPRFYIAPRRGSSAAAIHRWVERIASKRELVHPQVACVFVTTSSGAALFAVARSVDAFRLRRAARIVTARYLEGESAVVLYHREVES